MNETYVVEERLQSQYPTEYSTFHVRTPAIIRQHMNCRYPPAAEFSGSGGLGDVAVAVVDGETVPKFDLSH